MRLLAAEFGISDTGLAKLCARHEIPVPGQGWWARKVAGRPVVRLRLAPTSLNSDPLAIESIYDRLLACKDIRIRYCIGLLV